MEKKKDILYIDCGMGAAGDMFAAALFELVPNQDEMIRKLNGLMPDVEFIAEQSEKCGISGTHMKVLADGVEEVVHEHDSEEHSHEHSHGHGHDKSHGTSATDDKRKHTHIHRGLKEIEEIVSKMDVSDKIKEDINNVYKLIAAAEARAHGKDVSMIHFHEVGMKDAIADISAVCILMDEIKADEVISSAVCTGSGHVHCAHGTIPVPAPATAFLLEGIPSYDGEIKSELCTPTGAALIKYFANKFAKRPEMIIEATGYGMGKKDFESANCMRIIKGKKNNLQPVKDTNGVSAADDNLKAKEDSTCEMQDVICELSFNVDDMTGEEIAFATERIFEAGAVDVFNIAIGMKKSRPGIMVCVLCDEKEKEKIIKNIFKHTTTLGIRENISKRYILNRKVEEADTEEGKVHIKKSSGYGVQKEKFEYEDIAQIAKENDISLKEVIMHRGEADLWN